jgi:circadian clock protein KaiC
MSIEHEISHIEKLATGIPGFDHISNGGLPRGRVTLISGTAGSAKTVFATQFLAAGIQQSNEPGVFITFEEPPDDLRRNMLGFGWDIATWEREGRWLFVDASPQYQDIDDVVIGNYDLGALLARIQYAIGKIGARRVSMDSLGAVFARLSDTRIVRDEMLRISAVLKNMGVTSILTAERSQEFGEIARYGIEEFVADNVVILRNVMDEEKRRRTMEILKFRGTSHQKGSYPFTVLPGQGIVVIPLSAIELKQRSSNIRIYSGNVELDLMCGGGFFRDSIVLISGATGTGKTLMATTFMAIGAQQQERSLLFAFEESRDQLFRNASGWGIDFEQMEQSGMLRVICRYPESASLEDQLIAMKTEIEAFKPQRLAIDSLSALERVSTLKGFREFVIGLTSFIKEQEVAGMYTSTTSTLLGGTSITDGNIATITDSIILLRYVEIFGEMRRGLTVLKMRGSTHDKDIREFMIDSQGIHIGKPFRNISGILSGQFTHIVPSEIDRMNKLFTEDES